MPIKFVSDKKTLLSLILPAATAASNKSTLPALEGLLFTLKDDNLTVCGYDLEKGVRTSGTVVPKEDGSIIINASKMVSIVRNFPDCDILVEADDRNMVRISGGMSDFVIHGFAHEAFPSLPELGGENSFDISRPLMKDIINSTVFAVAQSEARPILMGELFMIENRTLTVVALDNFRLALREEKNCVFNNDNRFSFVVPGKALSDLARLLDDDEEPLRVEFTAKYIIFKLGTTVFFSRLLEGEYLDYKRALPTQNRIFATIDRVSFVESAERASLLVDEKLRTPLRCKFEDGNLNISCNTQYGSVNDNLHIDKQGTDIEIGFNNRYLLDALRACKDDTIKVSLSTPLMSMVIEPAEKDENSSYIYLVLPCKLKD
ncbi:MAG: DNA polymerase III subunit beta [Clostridiales bacterium]|nr:DNA polymerase III subunit beta [Candidatus Coliplasma equi]